MPYFLKLSKSLCVGLVVGGVVIGCAPGDKPLTNKNRPPGPLEVREVKSQHHFAYITGRLFEAKKIVNVAIHMESMAEREDGTQTKRIFKCPEMLSFGRSQQAELQLVLRSGPCTLERSEQLSLSFEGFEVFEAQSFQSPSEVVSEGQGRLPRSATYETDNYRVGLTSKKGEAEIKEQRKMTIVQSGSSEWQEGLVYYDIAYQVHSHIRQELHLNDLIAQDHGSEVLNLTGTMVYDLQDQQVVAMLEPKVEWVLELPRSITKEYGKRLKVTNSVQMTLAASADEKAHARKHPVLFDQQGECGLPMGLFAILNYEEKSDKRESKMNGLVAINKGQISYTLKDSQERVTQNWIRCKASTNDAARNWIPYEAIYLK